MSKVVDSLDRIQKAKQAAAVAPPPAFDETAPKESLFSRFGIILWLGASISATIFSYHLGVKQGMQAVKAESPRQWLNYFSDFAPTQTAAIEAPPKSSYQPVKDRLELAIEQTKNKLNAQSGALEAQAIRESDKRQGFTIQVITYVSEKMAKEEVDRLSKKGHKAFVVPSGKYFQVCIDLFESKQSAGKKLSQLRADSLYKTSYPGAYVKFLKQ